MIGMGTFILALVLSYAGTRALLRASITRRFMDVPNERSSHEVPKPRFGGIAIVGSFAVVLAILSVTTPGMGMFVPLVLGATIVFTIGVLDDLRTVRPAYRFAAQLLAATVVVSFGHVVDAIYLPLAGTIDLGIAAVPFTVLFIVAGIFRSGLAELDATFVLMPIDVLQTLIAFPPERVHEIAVRIDDPWLAPDVEARLRNRIDRTGLDVDVASWVTYRPELVEYAQLAIASQWVVLAIVFGMAIFGVANTMLMATFERRREFALLLAMGATPFKIVWVVVIEALALGAMSLAGGALVTFPVLVWWHNWPPDLSRVFGGFTMAGALVRPVLRVEYPVPMIFGAAAGLLVTALLAAAYPAFRAARVPPADTLLGR